MAENKTTGNLSRQLITFVIDNSASCSKEKLAALMGGIRRFAAAHEKDDVLSFELISYDTFTPAVIKSFDSDEIAPVFSCRMPLFGRAAKLAADRSLAYAERLRCAGTPVHRPWIFLLSDGFTLDDVEEVAVSLDRLEHEGKLLFLPFRLSAELYAERIQAFDRVKHMIEICDGHIDDLFVFVDRVLARRAELPADQAMKFQKSDFEGWALL